MIIAYILSGIIIVSWLIYVNQKWRMQKMMLRQLSVAAYTGKLTCIDIEIKDAIDRYLESNVMIKDHASFLWALIDYKIRKGNNTQVQLDAINRGFGKLSRSMSTQHG